MRMPFSCRLIVSLAMTESEIVQTVQSCWYINAACTTHTGGAAEPVPEESLIVY